MPALYLPTKYTIKVGEGAAQRQQVIIIPGAEQMDQSQLKEILQWQQEKANKELAIPKEQPRYSRKEVGQALNEYFKWRRKRE